MKVLLVTLVLVSATAVFAQPTVSNGGVLNAASFDTSMPVAPGSLISIFGTNLASGTSIADSIPLSASLGNVSATVNGIAVPLYFVTHTSSFDQINAQLPWNVPAGSVQLVVTAGGVASAPQAIQVGQFSPGIFSANGSGTGQAIAVNFPDYSYAAAAGALPGLTSRPAVAGDPNGIIIYATGLGAVSPAIANGASPSSTQVSTTTTNPTVLIGGVPAQQVLFSGLAPGDVGVYQLNVVLAPNTPTGNAVSLQIQMGGVTSTDKLTMAVASK